MPKRVKMPKKRSQRDAAITLRLPNAQTVSASLAQLCLLKFAAITARTKSAQTAWTKMRAWSQIVSTTPSMVSLHLSAKSVQNLTLAIKSAKIAHSLKIKGTLWTTTVGSIHHTPKVVVKDASHSLSSWKDSSSATSTTFPSWISRSCRNLWTIGDEDRAWSSALDTSMATILRTPTIL